MTIGIYRISLEDGRCYVGQSVDIESRWNYHRGVLRRGEAKSPYFQNCWNKYGEDAFLFEVLEEVDPPTLLVDDLKILLTEREQFWMDELGPAFCVLPASSALIGEALRRLRVSDKNRLSIHRPYLVEEWHPTKNTLSPADVGIGSEYKAWWLCRNCGHEWQAMVCNRSNLKTGGGCPACRNAASAWRMSTRVVSDETRDKIRVARVGTKATPESRAKMSAKRKGRPWSPNRRAAEVKRRQRREEGVA